jgi:hypothetical protein
MDMTDGASGIPRGVEVLVKKASVDHEFRKLLLAKRAEAATAIGLRLDPAEAMMINAVPAEQLDGIIARTTVSPMSRAAFLGKAGAVMLAALSAGAGCEEVMPVKGIAPDKPPARKPGTAGPDEKENDQPKPGTSKGIRPDRP